jgi:hypothetical protein
VFPQNSQLEKVTSRFLSDVESGLHKDTQSVWILARPEASDCQGRHGHRKLTADLPSSRIQRNRKSGLKVHAACRFASAKRDPDRALKTIWIGTHSGRDGVTRPCNTSMCYFLPIYGDGGQSSATLTQGVDPEHRHVVLGGGGSSACGLGRWVGG